MDYVEIQEPTGPKRIGGLFRLRGVQDERSIYKVGDIGAGLLVSRRHRGCLAHLEERLVEAQEVPGSKPGAATKVRWHVVL